jgi:hypothetical protein
MEARTTLVYTAPAFDSDGSCGENSVPLGLTHGLAGVRLELRAVDGYWIVVRHPAPGAIDTVRLTSYPGIPTVLEACAVPFDSSGNEPHCPRRWVVVNAPAGTAVPPPIAPELIRLRTGTFDLQGRRIEAVGPSGVVWMRDSLGVVRRRVRWH